MNTRIVTIALLLTLPAVADIAPNPLMTGGTNLAATQPARGTAITMLWEEVDLRPSAAKNAVEAVFLLKNTTDTVVKLEVGFPSYFEMPLKDFTVEVDGKALTADIKKTDPAGPKKVFTVWMCWPMEFAPGAEHKVKVTYWVPSEPLTHVTITNDKGMQAFNAISGEGLPDHLKDTIGARGSGYVLRTGAGWQGKIAKATIRLHHGDQFKKDLIVALSPAKGWTFDKEKNVSTLVLENLEPTEKDDISYQWQLSDQASQKTAMLKALRAGELKTVARMEMLRTLGYNYHAIRRPAPDADQLDVLLYSVAPKGPKYDVIQTDDWGREQFHRVAYQIALEHYRNGPNSADTIACATQYARFLEDVIKTRQAQREQADRQSQEILDKQIKELRDELAMAKQMSTNKQ